MTPSRSPCGQENVAPVVSGLSAPADLVVGMDSARIGVDAAGAAQERRAVGGVVSPHGVQRLAALVGDPLPELKTGRPASTRIVRSIRKGLRRSRVERRTSATSP